MIKAASITIERWEGTAAECSRPYTLTGEDLWKRANAMLLQMSRTAPKGGACDKTGFKVVYEDGHEYEGRYELRCDETPNLQNHMRTYCMFHAGRYCPPHLTEERYRRYLADIVKPEAKQAYETMLDSYEIGPSPKTEQELYLESIGAL